MPQTPISIHIPPQLQHYAVPPSQFLDLHPKYAHLVVGALILAPAHLVSPAVSRILLVQRAATERGFPNLWEIPGGSVEPSDPTLLHSVAREVFEETGLHLVRFVRQIGNGEEFLIGRHHTLKRCLKLSFEIEVLEFGKYPLDSNPHSLHQPGTHHVEKNETTPDISDLESINIDLDPKEHQAARWATEEDVKTATCFLSSGESGIDRNMRDITHMEGDLKLVSEDLRLLIMEAFRLHTANTRTAAQHTQESSSTSPTAVG